MWKFTFLLLTIMAWTIYSLPSTGEKYVSKFDDEQYKLLDALIVTGTHPITKDLILLYYLRMDE